MEPWIDWASLVLNSIFLEYLNFVAVKRKFLIILTNFNISYWYIQTKISYALCSLYFSFYMFIFLNMNNLEILILKIG